MDLHGELRREVPVHRGRLRDSIQVQEKKDGGQVVFIGAEYAKNLQFGRPPDEEPDLEALEIWARRKLRISKPGSWAVANSLQDKIAAEGPEKNPFVTRAIENLKEKY